MPDGHTGYTNRVSRIEIEPTVDVLVNTLKSDKVHLQNRGAIEGYLFVLFLALYTHSALLERLWEAVKFNRYNVADVFTQFSKAYRVFNDGQIIESEVPADTRTGQGSRRTYYAKREKLEVKTGKKLSYIGI